MLFTRAQNHIVHLLLLHLLYLHSTPEYSLTVHPIVGYPCNVETARWAVFHKGRPRLLTIVVTFALLRQTDPLLAHWASWIARCCTFSARAGGGHPWRFQASRARKKSPRSTKGTRWYVRYTIGLQYADGRGRGGILGTIAE